MVKLHNVFTTDVFPVLSRDELKSVHLLNKIFNQTTCKVLDTL